MKRVSLFALVVVCLLSVVPSTQAAESVRALDSNPYSLVASWWQEVVSFLGLGVGDLSFSASSSGGGGDTTMGGWCIDPNGVQYPAPCVENPPLRK